MHSRRRRPIRILIARALSTLLLLVGLARPTAAQTESVEYYATDAIGSVRVVFNAAGAVVGRMDYAPFGQELYNGLLMPNERFAHQTSDGESALGYAELRMYRSSTGRFTAVDVAWSGLFAPQSWNRYSYALNNPLRFVDPGGADPQDAQIHQRPHGANDRGDLLTDPLPKRRVAATPAAHRLTSHAEFLCDHTVGWHTLLLHRFDVRVSQAIVDRFGPKYGIEVL